MKASEDNSSKAVKGRRTKAAAVMWQEVPMLSEEEEGNFSPCKLEAPRCEGPPASFITTSYSVSSGVSTFLTDWVRLTAEIMEGCEKTRRVWRHGREKIPSVTTAAREGNTACIWDIRGRTGFTEDVEYLFIVWWKKKNNGWLRIKVNTGKYGQEVEDIS